MPMIVACLVISLVMPNIGQVDGWSRAGEAVEAEKAGEAGLDTAVPPTALPPTALPPFATALPPLEVRPQHPESRLQIRQVQQPVVQLGSPGLLREFGGGTLGIEEAGDLSALLVESAHQLAPDV